MPMGFRRIADIQTVLMEYARALERGDIALVRRLEAANSTLAEPFGDLKHQYTPRKEEANGGGE